jgi:hypothetical protein
LLNSEKPVKEKPDQIVVPVLFLVFNRMSTTRQVFEAIKRAAPFKLYVVSDGYRTDIEGEKEKVLNLRNFITKNVNWNCELKTLFRDQNLGAGRGVAEGIDWFFEHEKMGIILEHDCLPSTSFFQYCQELLLYYENNDQIWNISGFNGLGQYKSRLCSYHFTDRVDAWGWATWRRAWKYYDFEMKSLNTTKVREKIKNFIQEKKQIDFSFQSYESVYNTNNTWDYPWEFCCRAHARLGIIPAKNLIKNIGLGSDDAVFTKEKSIYMKLKVFDLNFPLKHPASFKINRQLSKMLFEKLLVDRESNELKKIMKKWRYWFFRLLK